MNQRHPQSMKEEPPVQLHDEADLVSFRTDALNRFISNHEYLENVTSKPIHNSKIIPPPSFPLEQPLSLKSGRGGPNGEKPTQEQLKTILSNLKPEDLYFGDLNLMIIRSQLFAEEIAKEKNNAKITDFTDDEEYCFQREKIKQLDTLQSKITDIKSVENLEVELESILAEYKTKFNKTYKEIPSIAKLSIPIEEISKSIEVTKAPANYNPRSISSFINIGNNSNPNNANLNLMGQSQDSANLDFNNSNPDFNDPSSSHSFNNNGMNMSQFVPNTGNTTVTANSSNFNHQGGMGFMGQLDGLQNPPPVGVHASASEPEATAPPAPIDNSDSGRKYNDIQLSNEDLDLSLMAENDINKNGDSNSNGNDDIYRNDGDDMVDDDINHLLNDAAGMDNNPLGIVNDDMGDLINFQGDDDDGMMGGNAFDTDFLSQIDHSME